MNFSSALTVSLQFGATLLAFMATMSTPVFAVPKVLWTEHQLSLTPSYGVSKAIEVSFEAQANLGLVEPFLVPSLRPYVTVSPSEPQSVRKGDVVTYTLSILIPEDDPNAFIDGTLHVRQARRPGRTVARPLPIHLNLVSDWMLVELEHFTFLIPPGFDVFYGRDIVAIGGQTAHYLSIHHFEHENVTPGEPIEDALRRVVAEYFEAPPESVRYSSSEQAIYVTAFSMLVNHRIELNPTRTLALDVGGFADIGEPRLQRFLDTLQWR